MIKGQFAKNLHKAVSERGIKQVELAKVLEVPPTSGKWVDERSPFTRH